MRASKIISWEYIKVIIQAFNVTVAVK